MWHPIQERGREQGRGWTAAQGLASRRPPARRQATTRRPATDQAARMKTVEEMASTRSDGDDVAGTIPGGKEAACCNELEWHKGVFAMEPHSMKSEYWRRMKAFEGSM